MAISIERKKAISGPANTAPHAGTNKRLMEIYGLLFSRFGGQHWWPAETLFEMAVGAILTQNTNWKNVERAIDNLKNHGLLSPVNIHRVTDDRLADLIRPSGYFTVKAGRLRNYINHIMDIYGGDFALSLMGNLTEKRAELLSISGIGPETADSILLYAGGHPTFVVDAYTRRVLLRHGLVSEGVSYESMRSLFMENLPRDAALFNEYHALLVAVGKDYCRPRDPRCTRCPLSEILAPQ